MDIENIVVLTGAGISAESGLATFRGPDGLWCGHRVEDVCTPEAYARDPALVQAFYNMRRQQLAEVEPNAAHHALARLAAAWKGRFTLVTQNVDDLHGRALAEITPCAGFSLIHMHGELKKARCRITGEVRDCDGDLDAEGTLLRILCGLAKCRWRWMKLVRRCANATCSWRSARRAMSTPPPDSWPKRAMQAPTRWS